MVIVGVDETTVDEATLETLGTIGALGLLVLTIGKLVCFDCMMG